MKKKKAHHREEEMKMKCYRHIPRNHHFYLSRSYLMRKIIGYIHIGGENILNNRPHLHRKSEESHDIYRHLHTSRKIEKKSARNEMKIENQKHQLRKEENAKWKRKCQREIRNVGVIISVNNVKINGTESALPMKKNERSAKRKWRNGKW